MYTSFEFDEILQATERALNNLDPADYELPVPPVEKILKLLEIIVKNNIFKFNNKMFRQILGVAMGSSCSPELADIRMYEILEDILQNYPYRDKIFMCSRFRDDGLLIHLGTADEIHELFALANTKHAHLKFTYEFSKHEITFLDTVIYKGERFQNEVILDIKTYIKPTETFQHLHRENSHPKNVFKGFIKGEILRYIRNTSSKTELRKQLEAFKHRLLKRGYTEHEINEVLESTKNTKRTDLLNPQQRNREQPLVMVTKYNPSIQKLKTKLTKHWRLISQNPDCANLFLRKPIIAYKRSKNLQQLLSKP